MKRTLHPRVADQRHLQHRLHLCLSLNMYMPTRRTRGSMWVVTVASFEMDVSIFICKGSFMSLGGGEILITKCFGTSQSLLYINTFGPFLINPIFLKSCSCKPPPPDSIQQRCHKSGDLGRLYVNSACCDTQLNWFPHSQALDFLFRRCKTLLRRHFDSSPLHSHLNCAFTAANRSPQLCKVQH